MRLSADLVVVDGDPQTGIVIDISSDGRILQWGTQNSIGKPDHHLKNQILMPGAVNAHSHAFQRLLRGRTQFASDKNDNFWTWRNVMYHVAAKLEPDSLYIAARQCFLEMLMGGITTVGEFHYLHHQSTGKTYNDPLAMSAALMEAARSVGIRLCLIRATYLRGDFFKPAEALQRRFCDTSVERSWDAIQGLYQKLVHYNDERLCLAVAAHSVRAMSIEDIVSLKTRLSHLPFHIHISEQLREVELCQQHYGTSPVHLLAEHGVLDAATTLVHATHLTAGEADAIAHAGSIVCVCPSTEADLGDGLVSLSALAQLRIPVCLGSDDQTLTSILSEARRLEMHERLRVQQRNIWRPLGEKSVAHALVRSATQTGGLALGVQAGQLQSNYFADFVAYDLNDPSLAGWTMDAIVPQLVFSTDSRALRTVIVAGQYVIKEGCHAEQQTIQTAYQKLVHKIFET